MRLPLANIEFKLVRPGVPVPKNQLVFHVPKAITKPEIRVFLQQLYGTRVGNINTVNYDGKRKRAPLMKKMVNYRQPGFKKAYVTFLGPLTGNK